jgi:hypothetical protein
MSKKQSREYPLRVISRYGVKTIVLSSQAQ